MPGRSMKHHKYSTEVHRCGTSSHLAESKILVLDLMLLYLSIDPLCLCHMSHKKKHLLLPIILVG